MQVFSIRDIENLTGIKAHTLRIWERRYTFFEPNRKEKGHRIYSNEDLQQLLRIAFLYHSGMKISEIARLQPESVVEQVGLLSSQAPPDALLLQLVEASLQFDEARFSSLLEAAVERLGFEQCILRICYPLLERIGLLWMTNHVLPAQEHFCSYLIQHRIIAETDRLPKATPGPRSIVLFSPQGEYHELPLLFLHYLFRKWGWNTLYLGGNVSLSMLQECAGAPYTYLFLHLITNLTGMDLDVYYEQVYRAFPDKKLVLSGAGALRHQRQLVHLIPLATDEQIYRFIQDQDLGNT
jgi:DNA-binding transcriptional MerR regulator